MSMEQLKQQLYELSERLRRIKETLDIEEKRKELRKLEAGATKPDFWQDTEEAKRVMRAINTLRGEIETVERLQGEINDALSVSGEETLRNEVERVAQKIQKEVGRLEINTFLSGKYDKSDAILSIHAGQGGTEAMDWAQMLYRMYTRYTERQGWSAEALDTTPGEEAGIKSVTIVISGHYGYGKLKGEAGTHRLVRQSPFNADQLRQTSFALVEVLPRFTKGQEDNIEIKDDELEWQFFRSGGHGGQNVNKVSTAVRLTHIPTGIVVTSQTERYQEQNRKLALEILKGKLWLRKEAQEKEKVKAIKGEYRPASWGTQIRSYVLHPYKMVKDLRTGHETSDTEGVLDGDIDEFIEAELKGEKSSNK
ncbi:MAG: peptide chain release factor 2 [Candidatus Blackburnbacteria bacterium]|nr:peptide chain release factor 2 [Candidatus Blackburnbacteria bacterium]